MMAPCVISSGATQMKELVGESLLVEPGIPLDRTYQKHLTMQMV